MKAGMFLILSFISLNALSQQERGLVRKGNRLYIEGEQSEADSIGQAYAKWDAAAMEYRRALEEDSTLVEGIFNLGDVDYKKGDYEEAIKKFEKVLLYTNDNLIKAKAHHNIGNSYLRLYDFGKSITAYKAALRLNPSDMDTKYNLAYAQRMLERKNAEDSQQSENKQQEPSEYAKRLKAEAEVLVGKKLYNEAFALMMEGLQKDSTVAGYQEFINRIEDVVSITTDSSALKP